MDGTTGQNGPGDRLVSIHLCYGRKSIQDFDNCRLNRDILSVLALLMKKRIPSNFTPFFDNNLMVAKEEEDNFRIVSEFSLNNEISK